MDEDRKPDDAVRVDRWLMAARFFKTRSQAAVACDGGKVKVNGISSKPHKLVRIGDRMTVRQHDRYRDIQVLGLAQRGLPPAEARKLYEEEPRTVLTEELQQQIRLVSRSIKKAPRKFKGRPTKKERRDMEKLGE
jgi:ribosome-associated heat shock protein Hsp15